MWDAVQSSFFLDTVDLIKSAVLKKEETSLMKKLALHVFIFHISEHVDYVLLKKTMNDSKRNLNLNFYISLTPPHLIHNIFWHTKNKQFSIIGDDK